MDRIVRINVTKNERNVTLNVVNNVIKIIVSQNSGGGGGSGITTLTSSGGTITITGSPTTKNLELSSSLLALINSALQDAPNNANAYVRSGLSWVIGYTKSAIDSLLGGKANIPTGTPDGTKYLRDDNTWQFLIDATASVKGIAKLYTSLGSNTDGAVDQNTVNTALSAKANAPLIDTVSSSALTGVTTEGILKSYLIPANTYTASEILNFANDLYKTGTAGTVTSRLYTNTTASLSGASLLAVNISTAGSRKVPLRRQLVLKGGTIETLATTATVPDDNVNSGTVATIVTFNPAIDNYFITTAQNASTGDSTIQNNFKIHF